MINKQHLSLAVTTLALELRLLAFWQDRAMLQASAVVIETDCSEGDKV